MTPELTPEEQAILDKAIAALEADPFRCGYQLLRNDNHENDPAKRYKLTELARQNGLYESEDKS